MWLERENKPSLSVSSCVAVSDGEGGQVTLKNNITLGYCTGGSEYQLSRCVRFCTLQRYNFTAAISEPQGHWGNAIYLTVTLGSEVTFEVFTAERNIWQWTTLKNGVFLDVTPCGPCKYRFFRMNLAPPSLRWQYPPTRRFLQEPHGVTSQKMPFFIATAVKTSNLTWTTLAVTSIVLIVSTLMTEAILPRNGISKKSHTTSHLKRSHSSYEMKLWIEIMFIIRKKSCPIHSPLGILVYEMLMVLHCLDSRLTDCDDPISLTRWPRSTAQKYVYASNTHTH
jgi:hypothetical protein